MNLVNNAAEALTTSSDITITTGRKRVTAKEYPDYDVVPGDYVTLTIADNGPGISPEDLKHIFEPFFTKKKIGRSGTGLGLTVVYNTIQDHKGVISVESDQTGSFFEILIPLCSELPVTEKKNIALEKLQGHGTILVVDDEEQQRGIVKSMLETLGYDVKTVASGEDAVSYLTLTQVDLVLLDMLMYPGISGLKSYEEIIKLHPGQKAIITSGYSESNEVLLAKELGVGAFIGKPFSLEQIGQTIKKVLT